MILNIKNKIKYFRNKQNRQKCVKLFFEPLEKMHTL